MHNSLATSGKCTQTWQSLIAVLSLHVISGFSLTAERMVPQKGTHAKPCSSQLQGAHYFIKADKRCLCYCSSFPGKVHMTANPKTDSLGEHVYLQE